MKKPPSVVRKVLVRGLEDVVVDQLIASAGANERSVEAEARYAIKQYLAKPAARATADNNVESSATRAPAARGQTREEVVEALEAELTRVRARIASLERKASAGSSAADPKAWDHWFARQQVLQRDLCAAKGERW
jgi:plasmid stability protein